MGACCTKPSTSTEHYRERIASLVPVFLERHCDLSDPDAYIERELFVSVFERFLYKEWGGWPSSLVDPWWCATMFRQECKEPGVIFWSYMVIGIKLKGLQELYRQPCKAC